MRPRKNQAKISNQGLDSRSRGPHPRSPGKSALHPGTSSGAALPGTSASGSDAGRQSRGRGEWPRKGWRCSERRASVTGRSLGPPLPPGESPGTVVASPWERPLVWPRRRRAGAAASRLFPEPGRAEGRARGGPVCSLAPGRLRGWLRGGLVVANPAAGPPVGGR